MPRHLTAALLASAALLLAACAAQQPQGPAETGYTAAAGNAAAGHAYVSETCAGCHAVEANENVSPVYGAPAFEDVANTPGMTPLALHVWLNSPHPNMPNLIIPPERIDDIAAYIATLKD